VYVPGTTPEKNWRFIVFLTATIRALHKYGDLLRGAIAVPGNDYRCGFFVYFTFQCTQLISLLRSLGAHEAPPAIMTAYLGAELDEVCQFLMGHKASIQRTQETIKFCATNLILEGFVIIIS